MTLWFVFALMTVAAIFAVLWPLSRSGRPPSEGSEAAVYRDQLAEIDRDAAAGLIGGSKLRPRASRCAVCWPQRKASVTPVASNIRLRRLAVWPWLGCHWWRSHLPSAGAAPALAFHGRARAPMPPSARQSGGAGESSGEKSDRWPRLERVAPVLVRLGRYDERSRLSQFDHL